MYHEINKCRICGNPQLTTVLELGEQFLTGVFPRSPSRGLSKGPVQLVKCTAKDGAKVCGLVQMKHTFAASEMYGETYGYRSGLNRSMVEHLSRKASKLQALVAPAAGDVILDIGSNDGTSLGYYAPGLVLVGIDPSAAKFSKYYKPNVELIVDFFSASLFRRRFGAAKARIVTSIAMFYDLEDPQAFVNDVSAVLRQDGVWHLEQSYLPAMLRTNSYDTACHEHIEYYALRQIEWMLQRAGLELLDIELNDINGGSFALTVGKVGGPIRPNFAALDQMRRLESDLNLDSLKPFEQFRERIDRQKQQLLALLQKLKSDGKLVVGYGASTKGNVLLQYCGITPELLPCIAEVNEDKFGCYTPGTDIPIVDEAIARAQKPDYFFVLPWHFRDGIIKRERDFLQRGGKLIFPLPTLEVVSGSS
jgi:hypothetical protein